MTITHSRRFRLAAGVLAQTALEEAILLDARAGTYFGANASASVILRGLIRGDDEADMLQQLRERFEADEEELKADLKKCLDEWLARGLIVEHR